MSRDLGKEFENRFRSDFLETFKGGLVIRLPDQMTGYENTSSNICDFICYDYPNMFFIECKSHKGASIPFTKISQYDKLLNISGIKGCRYGVVLWLYEKDKVYYIPVSTIKKLKEDGWKSVGIKALDEGYNIKEIPSEKLRKFMRSDYSLLKELKEGE